MGRIAAVKKSAISLLGMLLVLLTVSFLPFGSNYGSGNEKAAVKEKTILFQQIQELNNLPPAVDEKISPVLKDEANEAIYSSAVAMSKKDAEAARKVEFLARSSKDISGEIEDAGGEILNIVDSIDGQNRYYAVRADADKVAELAAEEDVARLSPRTVAYATLDQSVPMIKADAFWAGGYRGSGVRVAVLDTGIDKTHLMLSGRVVAERDFSETGSANDFHGHGTHVAGTIAGSKSAGGLYDGVAPDALLLNAKVLNNSGRGTIDYILAGMKWALDPDLNPATDDGAKIISMSLGMNSAHDADFENEIKSVVDKGVVVVVASGNCGPGCTDATCGGCKGFRGVTSPGSSPSVITVGAVDKSNSVAYFSGGGTVPGVGVKPDFVAPGVDIKSSVPGNGYVALQGTSMATPHVSGAVALMLNKNSSLKPEEIRRILEKTSVDLGDVGKDTSYGFGLIDMGRAFIYKEGMEFAAEIEKLVISGNPQSIKVTVFDDVPIKSVSADVTRPDGKKSTVSLSSSGGVFTTSYLDTVLLGIYIVDVTIEYGGSGGSAGTDGSPGSGTSVLTVVQTTSFKVTSLTGDFGNLEELNLSTIQFLSANLTVNLTFANTAATDLNFSALLQLYGLNGGIMDAEPSEEIRIAALPVAANSRASAYASSRFDLAAGNYSLRILTDYVAGSFVNVTNISVVDDLPPAITAVNYGSQLTGLSPQTFLLSLSEHGGIGGVTLSVNKSELSVPVNYTIAISGSQGSDKELAVTLFNGTFEAGDYKAVVAVCDEHGNCAESSFLEFWVSACDGKNVLVVKTYDSESVFESAVSSQAGLCLATLNRSTTGSPPAQYLGIFDAVIWTTGTDIVNINSADAAALADYYRNGGRVLVEGSDVAFRHGNDELMNSVLHAELDSDIGFTIASADGNLSGLNITLERLHPVVAGLLSPLPFNVTQDPFPDSVSSYNGSVVLVAWNGTGIGGSAIVAYESDDGKSKSLFLPFYLAALGKSVSEAVAENAVKWLVGEGEDDVSVSSLQHGFLVENAAAAFAVSVTSAAALESPPEMSVFLDGAMVNESVLDLSTLSEGSYNYPFELSLSLGEHLLRVVASSDFSLPELSYVNNVNDFALQVYSVMSDLAVSGFGYSYDELAAVISLVVNVSNLGGTTASSNVTVYLDGVKAASNGFDAGIGETVAVLLSVNIDKGAYGLRLAVDEDNSVEEFNESNNELAEKIYICSKEKVLVVDDNDAELFSTPGPSSADEFMGILRNSGYCAESWDETRQGVPSNELLNDFEVVVWSAGDYFNGTISYEDELAIGNYSGGLLVEGSDVGLDKSDSAFLQEIAAAVFSSDLLLNESQNESLVLKNHPITANISSISISKEKSPYPDSLEAVDAEVVAEWQNTSGTAALTARSLPPLLELQAASYESPYKTAYYAFSIDGITDQAAMERLVLNTVAWLLEKPNSPPKISNLSNLTVGEGENVALTVNATDLDGDLLVYNATGLPEGATFSNVTATFAWAPSFDQSGLYTVMATVSDSRNFSQGAINVTVTNINRPPLLVPIQNVAGFENITISIVANATDPDNENAVANDDNSLAFAINDSRFGQINGQNNVTFTFAPGFDDAGKFSVMINVSDGEFNDSQEVVVEVLNVNRAPRFENVTNQTVFENSTLRFFANATDPDEDLLLFRVEVPQKLSTADFDLETMQFAWTPTFDDSEAYLVRFIASDAQYSANEEVNITVVNVNRPPEIQLVLIEPPDLVMDEGETKTFTAAASDSDNDAVTVAWKVNGETTSTQPQLVFNTEYNDSGTYSIELVVSDYASSSTTQMTLIVQDTLECGTGQTKPCPMQQGVCASSFETCAAPGHWLGCSASDYGSSYVAEEKFCSNEPNVNSCHALCDNLDNDCDGSADEERACNTAPQLQQIGNRTVKENETLDFTVSATDAEHDALVFSASELPQGSMLDTTLGTSLDATAGKFSWVPGFEQAGQYTVTFAVSDGLQDDSEAVNITVKNTNRAPEVDITLEPPGVHVNEGDFKLLKANASDPDGDGLSYKWFMNGKLVSMYNLYYFSANWAAGDNNTLYEVVLNVSDGNITASVTTQLIVSNTQLCKPKETETAPCGSNIGMCRQGTQTRTCGNGYMWGEWGECVGEVKAVAEDCGTWEDDDCDGKVNEECQPDLAAAWMSFRVSDYAPGYSGELSMSALDNASATMRIFYYGEIVNNGKDASPPSFAVWYLNDRFFMRGYLPRVDAGGKVPVQMMTLVPYQDDNVAQLVLDADGKISEAYENNNDIDFTVNVNYNETYKEFAKKFAETYYSRYPTKEECETQQGKCWR